MQSIPPLSGSETAADGKGREAAKPVRIVALGPFQSRTTAKRLPWLNDGASSVSPASPPARKANATSKRSPTVRSTDSISPLSRRLTGTNLKLDPSAPAVESPSASHKQPTATTHERRRISSVEASTLASRTRASVARRPSIARTVPTMRKFGSRRPSATSHEAKKRLSIVHKKEPEDPFQDITSRGGQLGSSSRSP